MSDTIAIGSVFIECNHLRGRPVDLEKFRRSELHLGDENISQTHGTFGGMLRVLYERPVQNKPTVLPGFVRAGDGKTVNTSAIGAPSDQDRRL